MVANGQHLLEVVWKKALKEDWNTPSSLTMNAGNYYKKEYPGEYTNMNFFSTALTPEAMINMTKAGHEQCGAPGDIMNWVEDSSNWTLTSAAKIVTAELHEGPCWRGSSLQVFAGNFEHHSDCMNHCEKLGNGRSPPVTTIEEIEYLQTELEAIAPNVRDLPSVWLAATDSQEEGVWRDYYTGEELGNFTKACHGSPTFPWASCNYFSRQYNCLHKRQSSKTYSWIPTQCKQMWKGCVCQYSKPPMLNLRGLCIHSDLRYGTQFLFHQTASEPRNMFLIEQYAVQINYNRTSAMWEMTTKATPGVKATTPAKHISFALGKHEWTVTGDSYECHKGEPHKYYMKLTGCHKQREFTCDDGQCVTIEQRCDQIPDCRDGSDESGCQLLVIEEGYKKNVPPISSVCEPDCSLVPVTVHISISLLKIVSMEEVQHKIDLQFTIVLEWNEIRVKYQNLKSKASLNALTQQEIELLWLPYVVYDNTDMKEAVQLDYGTKTTLVINKEGGHIRARLYIVDEAQIFEGKDNKMAMHQTYTKSFQCQYHLQKYPFDTQVGYNRHSWLTSFVP